MSICRGNYLIASFAHHVKSSVKLQWMDEVILCSHARFDSTIAGAPLSDHPLWFSWVLHSAL